MTCTHDCGCTREAEPSKADCFRCFTARKAGRDCQPTTEQRILALVTDAERTGAAWLREPQIAAALRMEDSTILRGTLARMVASGAVVAFERLWLSKVETHYCSPRVAERRAQIVAQGRTPHVRTPMDTLLGKATLEAKVGPDRAADIIAGSAR